MSLYKTLASSEIFFIAGPCVLDTKENAEAVASKIAELKKKHNVPFIFKASFDKANRQSIDSYRGIDFETSREILKTIREKYSLPVLTDIHESWQADKIDFADVVQVPAFLCRQTDILLAAGKTNLVVNIKKGQFASAEQMLDSVKKVYSTGNKQVMLTERGTFFGYGDLVVDFRNITKMKQFGVPVIFDATHSVQKPGAHGSSSGGTREFIAPYAYASLEFGANGIFTEVHPTPDKALCDGPNSLDIKMFEELVNTVIKRIRGHKNV
ncbi:MAG: 3-deoxy-8-phosphooctulonate synthase [Pseudomonadota bacterium]